MMIILAWLSIGFIYGVAIFVGIRLVYLARGIGKNVEQVCIGRTPSFLPGDRGGDYKKRINAFGQVEYYRKWVE